MVTTSIPQNAVSGFNIDRIFTALKDFQKDFPKINDKLHMRREEFSDILIDQIVQAYSFLNELWNNGINLFSPSGLYNMLELNHLVLCGDDPQKRQEYYQHVQETRKRFQERISPIYSWWKKKSRNLDAFQITAGYYSRALSFPQLFFEGNHRTENIVINYYLLGQGLGPYIINKESAIQYLNLSSNIKLSEKGRFGADMKRKNYENLFIEFLKDFGNRYFLN